VIFINAVFYSYKRIVFLNILIKLERRAAHCSEFFMTGSAFEEQLERDFVRARCNNA
jgi:hypothetical protein